MTILCSVHCFGEYLCRICKMQNNIRKVAFRDYSGPLSYIFYLFLCVFIYCIRLSLLPFESIVYHYTIQIFLWNGLQNNNEKIKNFFFFVVTKLWIRRVHLLHWLSCKLNNYFRLWKISGLISIVYLEIIVEHLLLLNRKFPKSLVQIKTFSHKTVWDLKLKGCYSLMEEKFIEY